ncbi:MAG: flagellar basal-body rod protein FlgG [Planctomycetota bacterium]|nr:flagellar basal-body rod protein FlgG [Planctomycetota bacterium]
MAITALYSAASGLRALSSEIDVVSNNLANAETGAFKGSRVNFEDLFYQMLKQPGTTSSNGEVSPSGIFVGLGTRISNTQLDMTQGSLENTSRQLDVGISGTGFFRVKVLDSVGNGTAYTRNGNFFINNKGELVVGMGDGYKLIPPIVVPTGVTNITISQDGNVTGLKPNANAPSQIGQIKITQFVNPQGLNLLGGSLFQETQSSGPPIDSKPGDQGSGQLLQNFLEASNVDPVKELVTLIKTQRAFELNSESIKTADQALQTITNLRR